MVNDYITKQYLDFRIDQLKEDISDNVENKLTKLKSDIFNKIDSLAGKKN